MSFLFSFLKTSIKWLFILVLAVPLLVYFLLILINISDEGKSERVIEFEQFLATRATIDDKSNGFVYSIGLSAKVGDDFYQTGLQRIKQANEVNSRVDTASDENQVPSMSTDISKISTDLNELLAPCNKAIELDSACHRYLLSKSQAIEALLSESSVLLQRYNTMINTTTWYESFQANMYNYVSVSPLSTTHKIFMLNVWQEAVKGNDKTVTALLQQDSVFLRNALLSTHSLIHLMVMSAMLEQNYHWGSFALQDVAKESITSKNISTSSIEQVVPNDWRNPIVDSAFSFNKIAIGEWQFGSSVFTEILTGSEWYFVFIRPIFNMQNTLNLQAKMLTESAQIVQSNDDDFSAITVCNHDSRLSTLSWYAYNPMGKLFVCSAPSSFNQFQDKFDKLEQARLAALATATKPIE